MGFSYNVENAERLKAANSAVSEIPLSINRGVQGYQEMAKEVNSRKLIVTGANLGEGMSNFVKSAEEFLECLTNLQRYYERINEAVN